MQSSFNYFGMNEQQRMIRDSVLELLERVLPREKIKKLDKAGEFPLDAYRAMAEAGWMALPYPEEFGGAAGSHKDLAVLAETLGYHYGGMAQAYLTTVVYAGMHLLHSGSEQQKKELLPKVASGELRLAVAITEPAGGSDVAAIKTRAVRDGGSYVINGQKVFITNAHVAHQLVVVTKTHPEKGRDGMTMILVPAKAPGVTIRPLDLLGRHTTHACEVFFEDVRVPAENVLGKEDGAWHNLMQGLNIERMCLAASGAGNTQKIVDYTAEYAKDRVQFGRPISSFQVIQHRIVDMRIMAEIARVMSYRVGEMLDAGEDPAMIASMAKLVSTENNFKCADLGMQIMGGAGYSKEYDMEMFFRDSRVGPIGGGTSEIQHGIIAKRMGL